MSDVLRPYRDLFPQIGQRVMIDDSSVVIGDVRLADDVGIWPLVVIRGDVHYVQIGARTNIQDGSMLHVTHKSSYNPDGNPLTIGEDVTVGHKVMLHGCTIGNRVLVGMGSILLDGAIVEDDVMIGAGSLVPQNKRLESGYLYLGSPVKLNRPGFPGECFICELRLPDHRFRWKHNKLFLLLPEEYGPAFPAIVDCYTSPPT
ncbi:transferase [Escherichia coli]|nr:transferase [Escherichia coli]